MGREKGKRHRLGRWCTGWNVPCGREATEVIQPTSFAIAQRTGTIHSDLAVVVHRHERKGRVDRRIDDFNFQSVNRIDRAPNTAAQLRPADRPRA